MERAPTSAGSAARRPGTWRARAAHPRSRRIGVFATPAHATLLALLTAALLAAGTASASAVIVRLNSAKTLSYQPLRGAVTPLDAFFSNLDYNGGPVMPSNTNYAFYWAPPGSRAYPAEYQSGVNQYLEDLAHDSGGHENVDSISAQYNDAGGLFAGYESHFGGAIIDTDPYPANGCTRAAICLTDAQIRAELTSYISSHGLPEDLTHEYFLLTPPKVEDCFQASGSECSAGSSKPVYCAYHGNIPGAGSQIVYSNDPYVTGNFGCDDGNHPTGKPSDGALQGGLSHEHNESITDPEPNNAWTDIGGSGGEIGDKCGGSTGSALGKAPNGASYNQLINSHLYWYQEEWSNQTDQCLQRLTFSGAEPTATFSTTPQSGNTVSFDATGSTAPGGVARYNWQFNDGPGLSAPTETTSPTVSHAFPAAGTYVVALTVFAPDGSSIGTARTLSVGKVAAPTVTKIAPKTGGAGGGTTVKITGTTLAGATAVRFGSEPAASFTVSSATSILAVSPPGAPGSVNVTVTTPAGTSDTSSVDLFKYTPTITKVTPNTGSTAGGTSVTVSGSGFALGASATIIKFGGAKAASVNCTSSATCTVVSPAHVAGAVDVKATVSGVASPKSSATDQFTYA